MAALSGGHGATDFASGSVPALLPFFTDKFDLSYTLTAALMLVLLVSSSLLQPLFGLWSDRRGRALAAPGRARSRGRRRRPRGRRAELLAPPGARLRRRHRHRRVPPGGSEVRHVHQRPQARERDVAVQHRRQHRLRARADRRHAARALARSRARRPARVRAGPRRRRARARCAAVPRSAASAGGDGRPRGRRPRTTSGRWCCSPA